jgi:hypothetical protein
MENSNTRKRAAHRRRVQAALQEITEVVARALQKRLDLLYTLILRRFCDFGDV